MMHGCLKMVIGSSIEFRVTLLFRFAKGLAVIATQDERLFGEVLITSNRSKV